jgi:dipeptidase E
MKLYLSSYRIPHLESFIELVGKTPENTTIALIPNAKDYYALRAKAVKTREMAEYFTDLGFTVTVVDLVDYIGKSDELREVLREFDVIWARGGNTFCLREAMQASGFDTIIADVVKSSVVFAGDSAGACVAGTDLHGVELADDPEFAEKIVWDGLSLTPHYLLPHADNEEMSNFSEQMIADRGKDPTTVILNDNQAWVECDGNGRVVTGTAPTELEG